MIGGRSEMPAPYLRQVSLEIGHTKPKHTYQIGRTCILNTGAARFPAYELSLVNIVSRFLNVHHNLHRDPTG